MSFEFYMVNNIESFIMFIAMRLPVGVVKTQNVDTKAGKLLKVIVCKLKISREISIAPKHFAFKGQNLI